MKELVGLYDAALSYSLIRVFSNGGDVTIQFATPANGGALKGA